MADEKIPLIRALPYQGVYDEVQRGYIRPPGGGVPLNQGDYADAPKKGTGRR